MCLFCLVYLLFFVLLLLCSCRRHHRLSSTIFFYLIGYRVSKDYQSIENISFRSNLMMMMSFERARLFFFILALLINVKQKTTKLFENNDVIDLRSSGMCIF